jgi:uncharacterized protein
MTSLEEMTIEIKQLLPAYGTHGFEHTMRVYKTCIHIGKIEQADQSILIPAALLHDFSREEHNHAEAGAEKAKSILRRYNYSENQIEKISQVISTHSFSAKKTPKTLDAKILSDADKLDALGAIGIYRTATYSGEHERSIEEFIRHFHEKLLKLIDLLFTDEAKKMAVKRTKYMKKYLTQLEEELIDKT